MLPGRAAVGDPEGARGWGAGEARGRADELRRASGGGRLPAHPTRSPATSSTTAGRARGSRRRSAPLFETAPGARVRARGGGRAPENVSSAGAANLPSCSSRRLRAQGPAGWGCCRRARRAPVGRGCRRRRPDGGIAVRQRVQVKTGGRLRRRSDASWAQPRRSSGLRSRLHEGPLPS